MDQKEHACTHLRYPENTSKLIVIDEVTLSKGELYTYITANDKQLRSGALIATVPGTKAEDIIRWGSQIPETKRLKVKEISMYLAPSMKLAAKMLFPKAQIVTDRFHVVRLMIEDVKYIRITYRKEAIAQENKEMAKCRRFKRPYNPERLTNGDTKKELIAPSRYLLYKFPTTVTKHR